MYYILKERGIIKRFAILADGITTGYEDTPILFLKRIITKRMLVIGICQHFLKLLVVF